MAHFGMKSLFSPFVDAGNYCKELSSRTSFFVTNLQHSDGFFGPRLSVSSPLGDLARTSQLAGYPSEHHFAHAQAPHRLRYFVALP